MDFDRLKEASIFHKKTLIIKLGFVKITIMSSFGKGECFAFYKTRQFY